LVITISWPQSLDALSEPYLALWKGLAHQVLD
jgi:hypothetical protein